MKLTNSISKTKLGFLAMAAFGIAALGMTGTADAYRVAPNAKKRISKKTYNQMKRADQAQIKRGFMVLDKNNDGVLTKRDFVTVTRSYKWKRTRRGWKKVLVRKVTVAPVWHQLVRNPALNDHRITYRAFHRVRTAGFERRMAASYIVVKPRPHRYVKLPTRGKRKYARDARTGRRFKTYWGFRFYIY